MFLTSKGSGSLKFTHIIEITICETEQGFSFDDLQLKNKKINILTGLELNKFIYELTENNNSE